ncbi:mitochondrial carrier domain-containing protein [Gorgonomyces haynaldii]|nr:mitochondrial carrier domain-containing protein [Gorgonomyces haynaldii]
MSDNVAHAVAGAGGGMASMALTYPLITVSTRSQVEKKKGDVNQAQVLLKILKEEGLGGLYAGIDSAMFGIAVTQAVYYYFYELVKSKMGEEKNLTIAQNMASGAVAGAATSIITNPIWVLNTRMLVKKEASTFETIRQIYKEEGIVGFFKGLMPALVLVINPVIQYTVFERLKIWLEKQRTLNAFDFFLLGAFSKLCATSITYPYIVVKSRMQLKDAKDESQRYKSVMDGLTKIIKNEGVKGLYKGIESKLVQSVLSAAFTFAFKEEFFSASVWLLTILNLRAQKQ